MVGSVGCMVQNVDLLLLWVQVYDLGLTETDSIVVHTEDLAASGHWALGMRGVDEFGKNRLGVARGSQCSFLMQNVDGYGTR